MTAHNALQRTNDRQCKLRYDTNGTKFTRGFYASVVVVYVTDGMDSNLDPSFVSVKIIASCVCLLITHCSILDLERAGNPTATQLFEQLSVIVRDRLEDVQGN